MAIAASQLDSAPSTATIVPSVTAFIADRSRAYRFDQLPPDVVQLAKHCLLDWVGVAVAGSAEPVTALVRAEVLEEGGRPRATLLGTGERVNLAQAALVNGTASHALDFDDVSEAMGGHPSVVVFPGLLALAEDAEIDGRSFLTAFVAGYEAGCRVGRLVAPSHYDAGWHATGTVGTFSAAAAAAWALSLDEDQWHMALGIAGTQAAGLKSMFGTMCKPLHAGKATANGLLAARLAQRGVTAHPEVLDVAQGFAATQSTSIDPDRAIDLGADHYDLRDNLFKFHAACYFTHSSIDALADLVATQGLGPDRVANVELYVPPGHLAACNIPEPVTPLEAKFSLRFTAAQALAGTGTGRSAYSEAAVRDPQLVSLRDRVTVTPDASIEGPFRSRVVVTTTDGHVLRAAGDVSLSAPADQLDAQWDRLVAKFGDLAGPVLGDAAVEQIVSAIRNLEQLPSMAPLARQMGGGQ